MTRRANVARTALVALACIPGSFSTADAADPSVAILHEAKADAPGGITFLDPDSAHVLGSVVLPRSPLPLGFDPDRRVLYLFGVDRLGFLGAPGKKDWEIFAVSLDSFESRYLGVVGRPPLLFSSEAGFARLYVASLSKKARTYPVHAFDLAHERDLGIVASVEHLRFLTLSPDGSLLYALCEGKKHKKPKGPPGNLHVLDAATGTELARYDAGSHALSIVFDPNRGLAYVLGARDEEGRGRVPVLHRSEWVTEIVLPGPGGALVSSPDGVAYLLAPGMVARLSPDGRNVAHTWSLTIDPSDLVFDLSRSRAFAGEGAGSEIAELDLAGGTVVVEHSTGSPGKKAGKGLGLALATLLMIAAAAGGAPVGGAFPATHASTSMALSSDASALYVLNPFTNDLSVFDTSVHDVVDYIPIGGGSIRILRAPEDPNLWVESHGRLVRVNNATRQIDQEIDLTEGLRRAAVSYDPVRGRAWIVLGSQLRVLDLRTGATVKAVDLPSPAFGAWIASPSAAR